MDSLGYIRLLVRIGERRRPIILQIRISPGPSGAGPCPARVGSVPTELLLQNASQRRLEVQPKAEAIAQREQAGSRQKQRGQQIRGARHGVGDCLAHIDGLREPAGLLELGLANFP